MTPRTLLEFFADAQGLSSAHKRERIEAVVDQCALGSVIGKAIGKLSKGYRQHVWDGPSAAARARRFDPGRTDGRPRPEPDSRGPRNDSSARREQDILLSTHILQEVDAMCSRVLFIDEGRLRYDGTPADLTKDGKPLDEHFHELTTSET